MPSSNSSTAVRRNYVDKLVMWFYRAAMDVNVQASAARRRRKGITLISLLVCLLQIEFQAELSFALKQRFTTFWLGSSQVRVDMTE